MISLSDDEVATIWADLEKFWTGADWQLRARAPGGLPVPDASFHRADARSPVAVPILVVDQDETARASAVAALEQAGHVVYAADSAPVAFRRLEARTRIGLLFTDIAMPRIDGLMLADMAKLRRPDLRVLYTAADPAALDGRPGYRYGALLRKPYTGPELQAAVRATLGQPCMIEPGRWAPNIIC